MVNSDVDPFLVSRDTNFPWEEIVNSNKNIQSLDRGETLGYGNEKIKPRNLFSPKMKGKTRGDRVTVGVGFPQIKKDSDRKGEKTKFSANTLALDTVQNGVL